MRSHRRSAFTQVPSGSSPTRLLLFLLGGFILADGAAVSIAAGPQTILPQLIGGPRAPKPQPSLSPSERLEKEWPGHPEWLAMFVEVASDRPPTAGRGWYRKGVTARRFDWASTRNRLDRDKDGRLDRAEVGVPDADFRRLDRTRDGRLTEADFEFVPYGGSVIGDEEAYALDAFAGGDRNKDARLSKAEWEQMLRATFSDPIIRSILAGILSKVDELFQEAAREKIDHLALSELQEAFSLSPKPELLRLMVGPSGTPPNRASKRAMFRAFFRGELGSMGPGPGLDEPAPDFTLPAADGRSSITLSKLHPTKPVVLIFGNLTSASFRDHAASLGLLLRRYGGRAHFVVVYTREAHPSDGWQSAENARNGVVFRQPINLTERIGLALACRKRLGLELPFLVDTMDDRVEDLYSGMPSRLYLIDRGGRIAYKGGRGPFGFKPAELEQSLILLLGSDQAADGLGVPR